MTRKQITQTKSSPRYIPLNHPDYLYTFDLGAAASLISSGFELVSLDKTNPQKAQFIFYRSDGVQKIVDDYWSDKLKIKARSMFDTIKMLKNRLYSSD